MAYLIDTDVLIWHLRGHRPTVDLLRELAQKGLEGEREGKEVLPLGCSVISVFEVQAGMRPEEEAATELIPTSLERYPVDEAIARKAADYYRSFAQEGLTPPHRGPSHRRDGGAPPIDLGDIQPGPLPDGRSQHLRADAGAIGSLPLEPRD